MNFVPTRAIMFTSLEANLLSKYQIRISFHTNLKRPGNEAELFRNHYEGMIQIFWACIDSVIAKLSRMVDINELNMTMLATVGNGYIFKYIPEELSSSTSASSSTSVSSSSSASPFTYSVVIPPSTIAQRLTLRIDPN